MLYPIVYNKGMTNNNTTNRKAETMNNAQLTGIRQMYDDTHGETPSVFKRPSLTAREMALQPHELSRTGDLATLPNGRVYVWDSRYDHWAPWK